MHEVMNTTAYFTQRSKRAKVALGNSQPRYNSHVEGIRKRFYINSTRNSEHTPDWMNRTQSHYFRSNDKNKGMYNDTGSSFHGIRQTYAYQNLQKPVHPAGQFQNIPRKKMRSQWEMKNHSFQFEWPAKNKKVTSDRMSMPIASTQKPIINYNLPKYGIKQSPLHVQRQTPLKIGHSTAVDSIYIK